MSLPFSSHEQPRRYHGAGAVLAFDLGNNIGWAAQHADARIETGVKDFSPPDNACVGYRFACLRTWLETLPESVGEIEAVFYEDIQFGSNVHALKIIAGYEAILLAWCEERRIPYAGRTPGEIKKFITGSGVAPKNKADMERRNKKAAKKGKTLYTGLTVEEGLAALGLTPKDHNEADATALLLLGLDRINQKRRSA